MSDEKTTPSPEHDGYTGSVTPGGPPAVRELAALSVKLHSTLVRQGLGPGLRR